MSSQVNVLYTAMALLLAAAKWCPPLLKQQSLQAFMGNSASSLLTCTIQPRLQHSYWTAVIPQLKSSVAHRFLHNSCSQGSCKVCIGGALSW